MTYEEKKAWLKRYRQALAEEEILAAELEQLRAEAERVTPVLTGMPGGGVKTDKIPKAVERLLEEKEKLKKQIEQSGAMRQAVLNAIETLDSERDQELLTRRYILCQRWEEIAEKMNMDIRWITRLHRRIVECLKM